MSYVPSGVRIRVAKFDMVRIFFLKCIWAKKMRYGEKTVERSFVLNGFLLGEKTTVLIFQKKTLTGKDLSMHPKFSAL